MKRLLTLLAALMLMITVSNAQQNFYFWDKSGNVSAESIAHVDSLTFSGNWLFQISKPINIGVTTNAFQSSTSVALNDKVKSIDVTPEVGICYSDENKIPTYNDNRETLSSAMRGYIFTMRNYTFTIMNIVSGTTYYYRTYVKLNDEVYYSDVNSITTLGEKPQDRVVNGHKFVDLGLPSGLLWAETNIGASSATDDGDYYAWGEIESKTDYSWNVYKWGNDHDNLSKYNSSDIKIVIDREDGVATIKWGGSCRMPLSSEFKELCEECDWSWRSNYQGTSGFLITGSNGNTIFFPASGYRYNGNLDRHGTYGYYWTRSLYSNYPCSAYSLNFNGDGIHPTNTYYRYRGFPVRPVVEK